MTEKIRLKISPAVAKYVRPDVTAEEKLSGLVMATVLEPHDRITLIFCLLKDNDSVVKDTAGAEFSALPDDVLSNYIKSPDAHPSVLDAIACILYSRPLIFRLLLAHELLSPQAKEFLLHRQQMAEAEAAAAAEIPPDGGNEEPADDSAPKHEFDDLAAQDDFNSDGDEMPDDDAEINEEDDQYLSKYQVAQIMGISEKIKMALSGDKEWRAILVKDANKLVSGSVLKNPRITESEILRILKLGVQNDEIIRLICANREWVKNYQIRKALIDCPKTPVANSLRYLALLHDKDLAKYAKSRNISSVLSTQAKRMILAKQKKR